MWCGGTLFPQRLDGTADIFVVGAVGAGVALGIEIFFPFEDLRDLES